MLMIDIVASMATMMAMVLAMTMKIARLAMAVAMAIAGMATIVGDCGDDDSTIDNGNCNGDDK